MSHRIHDPAFLQGRFLLNGSARDTSGHGNHGTLVNAPTWGTFNQGLKTAIVLDGNTQHVNLGDLTYLNAVSALTICFWMNQDVLNQDDSIFGKYPDATHNVYIYNDGAGRSRFYVSNGATAYGRYLSVSVGTWNHIAMVFDGSQAGNANRLVVYADGRPETLVFTGTIPSITADLSGTDALIGAAANSLGGRLYDFRIYSVPLSRDEVNQVIHDPIGAF